MKRRVTKKVTKRRKKSVKARGLKKRKITKRAKTSARPLTLIKSEENIIISPRQENGWEKWQTFNPGVLLLEGKVHFLYRAIGTDGISRLGYAASRDGFYLEERLNYPVYEHNSRERFFNIFSYFSGGSWGGAEDPRLVRVDDEDVIYMTYTACDEGLRVALTSIKVKDFLEKKWEWKSPQLISPPGEVHKNWVIFPEKINGQYAVLHSLSPKIQIDYFDDLNFENRGYIHSYYERESKTDSWSIWIRGAGAPPIKTKYGWLLFYHAMDDDWSKYKVGAMLLDLNNPTEILDCAKEPVLEPTEWYENKGYKPGVVYVSGAVVKDGLLLVYYGAADNYVAVAYAPFDEFVENLAKRVVPKLKFKPLKKK